MYYMIRNQWFQGPFSHVRLTPSMTPMLDASIVVGCDHRFVVVVERSFDMRVPVAVAPNFVPAACSLGAFEERLVA